MFAEADLTSPVTIKQLCDCFDIRPNKRYGQNFLIDYNIVQKITDSAGLTSSDRVLEIGPGIGTLTREISKKAGSGVAVEVDKKLIPVLDSTLSHCSNIKIVNQDIFKYNVGDDFLDTVKVIGNLPYYITTPIVMWLLEEVPQAAEIVIMMQKEVAKRFAAKQGSRDSSAVTLAVQYYSEIEELFDVSKHCFYPAPKVDSTVVRFKRHTENPVAVKSEKLLFECIKKSFEKRRKTLINSLFGINGLEKERLVKILNEAGIDPRLRAENLTLQQYAVIANLIYDINN